MNTSKTFRSIAVGVAVLLLGSSFVGFQANASSSAPAQSDCDSGTTSLTWNGLGLSSPVVDSMSVDGEVVPTPATPGLNSLGVSVCPNTDLGARTGLMIYYHTLSGNTLDLTDALSPLGNPITTSSQIAVTMTNLGDNAQYFTFALVHGNVSNWTTANLGTASASLTFTVSPVRTPELTGDDAGGCTATPPDCHALKSDDDILAAGLDMSFDHGVGTNMRGAYFALTGAMGGFVTSLTSTDGSKRLVASLGGPHFRADGTTLNTGSMTAFIPTAALNSLFGLTSGDVDTTTLDVTRTTDATTTSDVSFSVHAVTGGVTLTVPTITFSSPKYTIKMTAAGLKKKKTIAVTPNKVKSTVQLAGTKVKANGKSTYKVVVTVRNKLGKAIKIQPTLSSASTIKVSTPTFKSNAWTFKVSATSKGLKKIRITAKGVFLQSVSPTFVRP